MGISYKILVADDEEAVTNMMVALFSHYGHQCVTAKDGVEALEKVGKSSVHAAIIDIGMPRMDGIALTRELIESHPGLPIMIITGNVGEELAEKAIAAGARDFIKKPFSIDEFILRFMKMMRDREGEEKLLNLSLTDELTELYNRRRFFILAQQCLKIAIRAKKSSLLFYIDMDGLKWINDHCGHDEGDRALRAVGNILKKTFRDSDVIARIGGDEFVVLCESPENDELLRNRLAENIRDYNTMESRNYKLSVSVGIALFDPEHPIPIDELLSKGDASMYTQKRNRRRKKEREKERATENNPPKNTRKVEL